MKTEFSDFCQLLGGLIAPYNSKLLEILEEVKEAQDADALVTVVNGLSENQHRLQTLEEKVAGQQAYVSIFGPLKSGKSTLMNAISGAYVSEITALPAYPCMVYVKDGPQRTFALTSYRGEKKNCGDSTEMQEYLHSAHVRLAEQIRKAEEQGEQFDPSQHYPDAIRRVDVELPAPSLRNSQTVLVDTPGLYSRMKFGYELMTREFRDSAACAIFVVKTDNLFLEQVFAEFNELLDLFSRIFLVVNLDSSKKDIGPDGQLRPSLESRNPSEVIRAFESLSMSAPLRKAAEEGRLKIYPIDLLHAALARMQGKDTTPTYLYEDSADDVAITAEEAGQNFGKFLQDLTDYLNSNDYILEFMGDSLRQAKNLVRELQEWCQPDKRESFELRQKSLRLLLTQSESSLRDLQTFIHSDATNDFEGVKTALLDAVKDFARGRMIAAREDILNELNVWWETDESLWELQNSRINQSLQRSIEDLSSQVRQSLEALLGEKSGGLNLTPSQIQFLQEVELPLDKVRESSLAKSRDFVFSANQNRIQLDVMGIPVKRGILDWLLFRGKVRVRKALFGSADQPDKVLSAAKKGSRLREAGREGIVSQIETHLETLYGSALEKYTSELLTMYIEHFQADLKGRLATLERNLKSRLEDCRKRLQGIEKIEGYLRQLQETSSGLSAKLEGIRTER